ncbi:hypothetical protein K501DRAFT_278183 [Backusella circina FSU 941]|nr:hypothetical protein K501DRAFT_278183 [Backusella circina FSU 941]
MSEFELDVPIESTEQPLLKRKRLNEPVTISDSEEDLEEEEDDEYIECMICSSNWKPSGKHRLVSLKCGHLFGKSCIERWIEDRIRKLGQNKGQCPICVEIARAREVRTIKHIKIMAQDNSITHKLEEEINQFKIKMRENQHLLDNAQLALNLCKRELKRVHENKDIKSQSDATISQQSATEPSFFKLKTSQPSRRGHLYRVMEVCTDYEAVVLSYQSQDNIHGIRKLSLLDMDHPEYIPLHSKSIRDIKSSPHQSDMIISTGLDKSLTLTSLKSNTKLHSYSLDAPAWSCHVDQHDPNILYCGLVNSTIMVFDIRNSKTHLKALSSQIMTSGSPLHSIQSVRVGDKKDTLLCSNLIKTFWWEDPTAEESTCTVLDVNNDKDFRPFSVSTVNGNNNNNNEDMFLLSSRYKTSTQHQIIKVMKDGKRHSVFTKCHNTGDTTPQFKRTSFGCKVIPKPTFISIN